jgi:hypothetical protein
MAIWSAISDDLRGFQQNYLKVPSWLGAVFIATVSYFAALLFVFPKYFAPLSPFHTDFFDYVSKANTSAWDIITSAPRPAAFFSMYLLGHLGVTGLLAAEIPIIILSILLMRRYIEVAYGRVGTLWQFAIYTLLIFSQQQFYFMYRHDLPYLIELLALLSALLFWHGAHGRYRYPAVFLAILFAFISCYSKETLYLAGPLLILLPSLKNRDNWRVSGIAAMALILIEIVCHLRGSPFSGSSDTSSPYYVDFGIQGLVSRTLGFIVLLMTPINAIVLIVAVCLTKQRVIALGLVLTGIFALIPNSALPNHIFEEYAWSGMPFLFAPILLELRELPSRALAISTVAIFLALVFLGPKPTSGSAWTIYQEKITSNIFQGVPTLSLLPPNSTILVIPPKDAPFAFWHAPSFVAQQFPSHDVLDILDPAHRTLAAQPQSPVRSGGIDDFDSKQIAYVARYDDSGALLSVQPLERTRCQLAADDSILPVLHPWVRNCAVNVINDDQAVGAAKAFSEVGAWNALRDLAQEFPHDPTISQLLNIEQTSSK